MSRISLSGFLVVNQGAVSIETYRVQLENSECLWEQHNSSTYLQVMSLGTLMSSLGKEIDEIFAAVFKEQGQKVKKIV